MGAYHTQWLYNCQHFQLKHHRGGVQYCYESIPIVLSQFQYSEPLLSRKVCCQLQRILLTQLTHLIWSSFIQEVHCCQSLWECLPSSANPSWWHTTLALSGPQYCNSLHTLPHTPFAHTSTLPLEVLTPPTRRTFPSSHSTAVDINQLLVYIYSDKAHHRTHSPKQLPT